jgi:hypothetical protein
VSVAQDVDISAGYECARLLDERIVAVVNEVKSSPVWEVICSPGSDLIRALIREVYWEVHCYHPSTTKTGFAMLGRIDPSEIKVLRNLLLHKWEEVEHRVWALDGYLALGGDLNRIGRENQFMSPGAFAVAAVWERLSNCLPALSYLGAEYLFEDLTAKLASTVINKVKDRKLPVKGMQFITDHATEDERHSTLLKKLVIEIVARYPELQPDILYAFDCFRQVYPMPLWLGSYRRAVESFEAART